MGPKKSDDLKIPVGDVQQCVYGRVCHRAVESRLIVKYQCMYALMVCLHMHKGYIRSANVCV